MLYTIIRVFGGLEVYSDTLMRSLGGVLPPVCDNPTVSPNVILTGEVPYIA